MKVNEARKFEPCFDSMIFSLIVRQYLFEEFESNLNRRRDARDILKINIANSQEM